MADWLYPISENASSYFVDEYYGNKYKVSFENFRDLIVTRRVKDDWWYLTTGYRKVQRGDRLWVYTGDRGLGVIGLARIVHVDAPPDHDPGVRLKWDFRRSAELVVDPFPAERLRKYVPFPLAPVIGLDRHPRLIRELEGWPGPKAERDEALLKPLHLRPVREVLLGPQSQPKRMLLAHDGILFPIRLRLERSGWAVGVGDTGPTAVDLLAVRSRRGIIVEAKTVRSTTGRDEARAAFAQLHEYRWSLGKPTYDLWAAFSRRPAPEVVEFLEAHDVRVSWSTSESTFRFARASRRWAAGVPGLGKA